MHVNYNKYRTRTVFYLCSILGMKRFIRNILFFVLPIAITLCALEFGVRRIPNNYSYKANWLNNNINQIKILTLGASNGYYGIQPRLFNVPAFNAAHVSQTPKYDNFIFNKYIEMADSLKLIIYPLSYCSLSFDLENGIEWWRTKNYTIYYNCPYHKWNLKYSTEIFSNSSVFVLCKRLKNRVIKNYSDVHCDSLGWGTDYRVSNKDGEWLRNGVKRAEYQTCDLDACGKFVMENKRYIEDIIVQCYKRNINVMLLITPTYRSYYDNLNIKQLDLLTDFCDSMSIKYNNTTFVDLLKDCRFVEDDFYDADHLNEVGALKLTSIICDYQAQIMN